MKKKTKNNIEFLILLSIFGISVFSLGIFTGSVFLSKTYYIDSESVCEDNVKTTYSFSSYIKPLFLRLAEEVANSRIYEIGVYDCDDFSADLVRIYRQIGYKANSVSGYSDINSPYVDHAWVEVVIPIEAVTGNVIEPSDETYIKVVEIPVDGVIQ